MEEMTVTMSMRDFETMRNQIDTLRNRDTRNYVESKGVDILANDFVYELDLEALIKDLKVDYPNLKVNK